MVLFTILITISVIFYFVFDALGLLSQEGLAEFIESGNIYVLYLVIFVVQACCLCFIPGSTALFCAVGVLIFGYDAFWTVVLLNVIGAFIVSQILFFFGRYGGRGLIGLLFGDGSLDKTLDTLDKKGAKILPLWYLLLIAPDDLMAVACGSSNMSWKKFTVLTVIFRSIGISILTAVYFYILPWAMPIIESYL